MEPKRFIVYVMEGGRRPYVEWVSRLRDEAAVLRIRRRLLALELEGHFGDFRPVGDGVFELRFHFGPGYRVYFGQRGTTIVVLLCGGDKQSQEKDIIRAKEYYADWLANPERSEP